MLRVMTAYSGALGIYHIYSTSFAMIMLTLVFSLSHLRLQKRFDQVTKGTKSSQAGLAIHTNSFSERNNATNLHLSKHGWEKNCTLKISVL